MYGADFHVVNAFMNSMNYPDRSKLANETNLLSDKIHVEAAYTDEAVSKVAKAQLFLTSGLFYCDQYC